MYKTIRTSYLLISLILLALLASCAAAKSTEQPAADYSFAPMEPGGYGYEEAVQSSGMNVNYDTGFADSVPEAAVERVVIKNANISIVVDDPVQSMSDIIQMAEEKGGFVVTSNLYKTTTNAGYEVNEASLTIRVPSDQLNDVLDLIKAEVNDPETDVLNESISGQDVTSEYTDLKSRLRNLEAAEEKLNQIMDEAYSTEDVLSVYNQLVAVQEQIELIKGQIKYYDEASAMSAISISIIAAESIEPLSIGGWQPAGEARDATQALINALKFFVNAGIWIIIFVLPVVIILAVPFVIIGLIVRYFIKRRKARAPQAVETSSVESESADKE